MIEKIVFDFLISNLSVPVYMETPINAPENYALIEKTGSGESDRIKSATFVVQSYGKSLYDAAVLNEEVKTQMLGNDTIPGLNGSNRVFGVSLNSDYNFTDTATKRYRYQAVFDIYY